MIYQNPNFSLDTQLYLLERIGEQVEVEPQVFDLLIDLIENRNRVVARDELLDQLWKGRVVSESALTARLKAARKAVGDSGSTQNIIQTIHGRGYRFIADIAELSKSRPASEIGENLASQQTLPLPDKPSIAVLPFQNLSDAPKQDYFSGGITEDIITALSRFHDLFVIARNSTLVYSGKAVNVRDVGRELGVQYVLEGSVQKAGNQVRVSAQLIDATTDHHLWADRYDRELKDIFAVQDEITETIVSTIVGRVEEATLERARRKSTDNLASYDYVLRADEKIYYFTREETVRSRQTFFKAMELDPQYARAYSGVAMTYISDWGFLWGESPADDLQQAFEYAQKAVALDDADNRSHAVLAIAYVCRHEYAQARVHQQKSIALNPNDADILAHMGYLLPLLGEHEEAVESGERAIRLNPYYPRWYLSFLDGAYYAAHRYADAIAAFEGIQSSFPDDLAWLAASYAQLGQHDKARALMSDYISSGETKPWWSNVPESEAEVERDPTGFLKYLIYMYPFKDQADLDHHIDGLRKAGLPD